jgi:hypothetical protein
MRPDGPLLPPGVQVIFMVDPAGKLAREEPL